MLHLVVDAANVVGSRPDGWWRDRAGAARRLAGSIVAVHGCPKPPPTRVSLTLPAIRRSTEVWILATGDAKAGAVALALSGAGEVAIPVAGATGTHRTLWLLDRAAAAKLPRDLGPPVA